MRRARRGRRGTGGRALGRPWRLLRRGSLRVVRIARRRMREGEARRRRRRRRRRAAGARCRRRRRWRRAGRRRGERRGLTEAAEPRDRDGGRSRSRRRSRRRLGDHLSHGVAAGLHHLRLRLRRLRRRRLRRRRRQSERLSRSRAQAVCSRCEPCRLRRAVGCRAERHTPTRGRFDRRWPASGRGRQAGSPQPSGSRHLGRRRWLPPAEAQQLLPFALKLSTQRGEFSARRLELARRL